MTWQMVAGVLGAIVLLGNAGAVIYKWISPALKVKEDVEELDRRTKKDFEAIQKLEKALEHSEKVSRMHLVVMLNMLNHMIDGNNTDAMKKTRSDIENMLAGIDVAED